MLQTIQAFLITLTFTAFSFADVFMTELADPQNQGGGSSGDGDIRYVELYNNSTEDSDFSTRDGDFGIVRWTNGSADPTVSSFKSLAGGEFSISAHGFFIICNDADKFSATYGFACDQNLNLI